MLSIIMGFSQVVASSISKTITDEKGNDVVIKLDCYDLTILRWFVGYMSCGKLTSINVANARYFLIHPEQVFTDIPLLNCGVNEICKRLDKLVQLDVLNKYYHPEFAKTFYAMGSKFIQLIHSDEN